MPYAKLAAPILAWPRSAKRLTVLVLDAAICVLTVWLAYYLRLGEFVSLTGGARWAAMMAIAIALPLYVTSGLYRAIFRYAGWSALMAVVRATAVYAVVYAAIFTAWTVDGVPRTIGLIQPLLLLFFIGASRAFARYWLGGVYLNQLKLGALPRVLIYGAGSAGRQLASAMNNSHELRVVGFVDDDERLHNHVLNGLNIYSPVDIGELVNEKSVQSVLLAIPSASRSRRNNIIRRLSALKISVRTLPGVAEIAQGKVSYADLRELDLEDLLGREAVEPDPAFMARNTLGKTVLVTGAGGSIGSELCRQIVGQYPATLLLMDSSEYALYAIHQELEKAAVERTELIPLLADVKDELRMREVLQTWQPHTIYHAAAYKHVPLVEHNPAQGVLNNVFGTLNMATLAGQCGVNDVVLISTDKAVRPTNIMGASKRLAEMVLQALAHEHTSTCFSMVRFGNVLGSSGSVVPKFRAQINAGGPISLTHPDITRYFMTIPEAAQLVIQAGAMAKGGEVFVLDMGEPVKIKAMAERMVELSGLSVKDDNHPDGDIEISITGLRPGEKLYEELLIGDNPQPTKHPRIMKATEAYLSWSELSPMLDEMRMALTTNDVSRLRSMLTALVDGYVPNDDIVDWVTLARQQQLTERA